MMRIAHIINRFIGIIAVTVAALFFLVGGPLTVRGSDHLTEVPVDSSVNTEVQYLLDFIDQAKQSPQNFQPQRISRLMDFVSAPKDPSKLYYADKRNDAPSAYHEMEVPRAFAELIRYSYNDEIIPVITQPSSLRLSYWKLVDGKQKPLPRLWEYLSDLSKPVIITGVEHYVNTPDTFSGAYYDYELDRVLILFRFQNRKVILSLSKQKGISGVGKKGLILGTDDNWDYFYTGQDGLTAAGLGWVQSHMYDSYSVIVCFEPQPGQALTKYCIFKWVRAGWAKYNFVKHKHIHNGLKRFEKAYRQVMDSPVLPTPKMLADASKAIRNLSQAELVHNTKAYFNHVEHKYGDQINFNGKRPNGVPEINEYIHQMTPKEMQSLIMLQCLKMVIGKDQNPKNMPFINTMQQVN